MNIVNIPSIEFEPGSKGDFAVRYASIGWNVIPLWWIDGGKCACGKEGCSTPGKHPYAKLAPFGQKSASKDAAQVKRWWQSSPHANIGIYLAPSGLCAIDIDPRNGGIETMDEIEAKHGPINSELLQFTGGGGEHRVFERPSGTLPGKLGKGVDVKLDGYIVVEPSCHLSGKRYEWEASSNPLDGSVASPIPEWIRDLSGAAQVKAGGEVGPALPIDEKRLAELRQALPYIIEPDRDTWLAVGFALHNDIGGQFGFDLWDQWAASNGSEYDPKDQMRVWRSFKRKGIDGVTLATIFGLAMDKGWANIPEPEETPENIKAYILGLIAEARAQEEVKPKPGEWKIPIPALQEIADWFSTLSEEPHPMISIVGALAFGSVIAGRRYRSVNANWTAMQYVLAAPSGVGKNYIKSGINRLLHAATLEDFFGANFYTHSAAVYWALNSAPTHICVTDEFGDSFAEARKSENGNKMTVFKALKQVYSDVDDTFRADAYSMSGLSKKDREEKKMPAIVRPSLTLLGLTTPGQFYHEIKASHIEGGMMNRFVVFNVGRDPVRTKQEMGDGIPTESMIANTRAVRHLDAIGRDGALDAMPMFCPVDFDSDAKVIFDHFKDEADAAGDALESSGMDNMPRRWRENAMRIATMLAAWDNPTGPVVTKTMADWSCKLVRHCGQETIRQLVGKVADSDYQMSLNQVLQSVKDAGLGVWVSKSDLLRRHRGIKGREMADLLSHLVEARLLLSQRTDTDGRTATIFTACPDE